MPRRVISRSVTTLTQFATWRNKLLDIESWNLPFDTKYSKVVIKKTIIKQKKTNMKINLIQKTVNSTKRTLKHYKHRERTLKTKH